MIIFLSFKGNLCVECQPSQLDGSYAYQQRISLLKTENIILTLCAFIQGAKHVLYNYIHIMVLITTYGELVQRKTK